MIDLSIVLTAHREGPFLGATIASAVSAVDHLRAERGVQVELVAVLDKADAGTKATLESALSKFSWQQLRVLEIDEGDPGGARNVGIDEASGQNIAILDGDDLWSYNWLAEAMTAIQRRPDAIFHSAVNFIFGVDEALFWHIDSEGPLFDPLYLTWNNYWDALSFGRREIYIQHRFRKNDLRKGFGHEDWYWNVETVCAGIPHKPVPDTMHFKRRRQGSQMAKVALAEGVPWPSPVVKVPLVRVN